MTDQNAPYRLPHTALSHHSDSTLLPALSTDAPPFDPTFAQHRAINAIDTALDIQVAGYHIFAIGEHGLGKKTLITKRLSERAGSEPTPDDLVFIHNFDNPRLPIAIHLPNGLAPVWRQDMIKLWQSAQKKLINKLTSLNYQNQLATLKSQSLLTEKKLIAKFNESAKPFNAVLSSALIDGNKSSIFTPLDDNKPIKDNAQDKLHKKFIALNHHLDELDNATNQKIDDLHRSLSTKVLTPLFDPLVKKYQKLIKHPQELNKVITHLNHCLFDMVSNALDIVDGEGDFDDAIIPARYGVNVLVSHDTNMGAPVIFEDLPTHLNLLGHIEYTTELGTAYSDVSMIRAGSLMRANGGYLLLNASQLLEHPYAWQGLKRALQSEQIKLSSLEQMLTLTGSLSLEPMSIPLSVKVILLGDPDIYYELLELEPELHTLFKIHADFNETAQRNLENELQLIAKINDIATQYHLLPFNNTACAKILDTLARFCDDKYKLDLHSDRLRQLLLQSHRHALLEGKLVIDQSHVKKTLTDIDERSNHVKQLYWQDIKSGQQLISTTGKEIGQINALTVISHAHGEFGLPARLTATIAPKFGNGEILDIERDVELGGSLHAKGMLIMTGFLRSQFSEFAEMNFSASLAFEQSYGQIDGDSATLAECCALLSALAHIPINQSLAITGSMNQLGQAQAIGGVNAKIEGFFEVCRHQGLTGTQGVIIPKANLNNLMLDDEIIRAVQMGQFHIYAIETIYDALYLLTNTPVNDKNKRGGFKKGTVFYQIVERLKSWENKDENK